MFVLFECLGLQFGHLEMGLWVIYAPKVATGSAQGFNPGNPPNKRVRPERARG
jgi:hypothetical protein